MPLALPSAALSWEIVKDTHAFLVKQRTIKKPFSKEPNNLTNLNSFRYNGFVHKKTLGVVPAKDNKGFNVVYKRQSKNRFPAKRQCTVTMKSGPRRALGKLKKVINKNKYRRDLKQAALKRASAVLRSQKPVKDGKKGKPAKKTE